MLAGGFPIIRILDIAMSRERRSPSRRQQHAHYPTRECWDEPMQVFICISDAAQFRGNLPVVMKCGLALRSHASGNPSRDNLDWLAVIKTSLAVNYIITC